MKDDINEVIKKLNRVRSPSIEIFNEVKQAIFTDWDKILPGHKRGLIARFADISFMGKMSSSGFLKDFTKEQWLELLNRTEQLGQEQSDILDSLATANPNFTNFLPWLLTNMDDNQMELELHVLSDSANEPLLAVFFEMVIGVSNKSVVSDLYIRTHMSEFFAKLLTKHVRKDIFIRLFANLLKTKVSKYTLNTLTLLCKRDVFVSALLSSGIKSADVYKITKNPEFLPDVMKKIFLIKDEK